MPEAQPASLSQWLSRIEALHPAEIELGLERSCRVADQLGLRQGWHCPIVTLAGTNGKGSTQSYLGAMLSAQGYRVASYSSPHLLRYNERVRLSDAQEVDQCASDQQLCDAFAAIDQARLQVGVSLTYFEYATLAALWLFREWQPDVVLLEVGLGGRLDAVNIIDADIAVITTVALDHQDWLGNDREAVGFEKAGILRSGKPVVYGEPDLPASVAAQVEQLACPLYHWGADFSPVTELASPTQWSWRGVDRAGQPVELTQLPIPSLPFENASTAIQVLELLPLTVAGDSIRKGLIRAQLAGRFQQVRWQQQLLILDVAHNPHAAAHLVNRLEPIAGKTLAVVGMLQDKDCRSTLAALAPAIDQWLFCDLDVPRGCTAVQLKASLSAEHGTDAKSVECYGSPLKACQIALELCQQSDRILVVGSFFTVSAVLAAMESGFKPALASEMKESC